MIEEATLLEIERTSPDGLSSAQILQFCQQHGVSMSEATLRKYVQLGLLPRSVRVGEKGKHRGSKGLYPARVIRRLLLVKTMMAQNVTIEQIQKEFLLLGADVEQIGDSLAKLFERIREAIRCRGQDGQSRAAETLVERELSEAERARTMLLSRLERIEAQLRAAGPRQPVSGSAKVIQAVS